MMKLYLRSPICDHGLVLNDLSAETNLPSTLPRFPVRECQSLMLSCARRKTGGGGGTRASSTKTVKSRNLKADSDKDRRELGNKSVRYYVTPCIRKEPHVSEECISSIFRVQEEPKRGSREQAKFSAYSFLAWLTLQP
jgi:hypothetical protein